MGQKVHPVGFRLGILRSWDSNWYDDKDFAGKLQEDAKVRHYVHNRLKKAGISRILIDRTPKKAVITIHTSRPGIVIGRSGKEITQLEEELKQITARSESFRKRFLDSRVLALPGTLDGETPDENDAGGCFDETVDAEAEKDDAVRPESGNDHNHRFDDVPRDGEVLESQGATEMLEALFAFSGHS